ncbi:MAG: SRPBCC domain-containing protein [Rhodocyclaceae bacterium]
MESVVTLTVEAEGAHTRMQLCHRGVPDDAMGRRHQEGWGSMLDAIAQRFSHGS